MLIIVGIAYIIYKWIEAIYVDTETQQKCKSIGAKTYRSNFGGLRWTETGKPLTDAEVYNYYRSKRGK